MSTTMDREFQDTLYALIVSHGNQINERERKALYNRVIRLVKQLEQQIAELKEKLARYTDLEDLTPVPVSPEAIRVLEEEIGAPILTVFL